MDLFQRILPEVREVLLTASAPQLQAFLDSLLREGILSKEYCQTLLCERDADDLARKLALTLLGKQAGPPSPSCLPSLHLSGNARENANNGAVSLRTRNRTEHLLSSSWESDCREEGEVSPGGIPPEAPCLQREAHPPSMDEMEEAPAAPVQASEGAGDGQENPELFYTVERDESGDVVCLCSDMGEAYDKIAALAEYLLKDHQEAPVDEHFESLFWDGGLAEGPGGCAEAKTRGPSPDAPAAKRQRLAHPPALCIVSGDPLAIPLNPSQDGTDAPPDFHVQILVATVGPAGRPPEAPGPSASGELWCIPHHHRSNVQVIFTFENAPQPCSPPEAATCPGAAGAFCQRLKEHLRREWSSGPGQPPGGLYLERDLVQHHLDGRGGGRADLRRCHLGEKRKAPVERSGLFQAAGKKSRLGSRVIVVLGKAGTGKSLLVRRLCLDWAEGLLPQFDFVLPFDCRRLSLLQGACPDLRSLLSDTLGEACQGLEDAYARLLQRPERLLLLFDGVGDLRGPQGLPSLPGSLGAVLGPLFRRETLNGCTLLLTRRPKERLPPYFPRVDAVLEVVGLSPEEASLCLAASLEGSAQWEQQASRIRASPYLFSHCENPGLCRFLCRAVPEAEGPELPSTLTGLLATFLLRKAEGWAAEGRAGRGIAALAELSWSLGQRGQKALLSEDFPSAALKDFALSSGLMEEQRGVSAFSSFVVQDFLLALHLTLAREVKGKTLTKYLGWGARSRKGLSAGGALVPRFLSGLLFLKDEGLSVPLLLGKEGESEGEKMMARKQRSLSRFIRKLPLRDFSPDKLLELLHCLHETEDPGLFKHVSLELGPELSFLGFPLPPPDVSVLHSFLRRSSKGFSLDLRGSCLPLDGLRTLVDLKSITKFRVSLGEAVALWKHLWDLRERKALQAAMEKFLGGAFRAKAMGDVDALLGLVQLQRDMADSSSGRPITAVAGFLQLEFSLGPSSGLEAVRRLADSLAAFSALQHLDLDSPQENEIGDEGVGSLSRVLPALASLQTLNLSRNKITDLGAELLARALPSLRLLKTLSLYENNIGDGGAERLAEVLPQMCALRVLDLHCNQISAAGARCLTEGLRRCPGIQSLALWNPRIPHGVLDHLQQLDSRIRRF